MQAQEQDGNGRVEMEIEPRPETAMEGDQREGESDWLRAGHEERCSAAGAAAPATDRAAGSIPGDLQSGQFAAPLYNPVEYPWESIVHWSDRDRLKSFLDSWGGQAVADGADGVERDELDAWQNLHTTLPLASNQ